MASGDGNDNGDDNDDRTLTKTQSIIQHDGGPGAGLTIDFKARDWPWKVTASDMVITRLGDRLVASPLIGTGTVFVDAATTVLLSSRYEETLYLMDKGQPIPRFQRAGPRHKIFFQPRTTTIAVVTCGGLCPGLNDVIRGIVLTAKQMYGVPRVLGVRHGYSGLRKDSPSWPPVELTEEIVSKIHEQGGSILGMSRGPIEPVEAVDALIELKVDVLFCIGGDGTQKAAHKIHLEIKKRDLPIGIIGLPKTIDNDINFIDKTFGFDTAVEQAAPVITSVATEAESLQGGVGLVKLMGRDSGFIAAHATLAAGAVDFVLVPEIPVDLPTFLSCIQGKIESNGHVVVVTAEGAGQAAIDQWAKMHTTGTDREKDRSGNVIHKDVGLFLKDRIKEHAELHDYSATIKYIDPSYLIRSTKVIPSDAVFCIMLAQNAVHAAMAGKTDMLVGTWHGRYTYVPLSVAVMARRHIDVKGALWSSVVQATEIRSLLRRTRMSRSDSSMRMLYSDIHAK